MERSPTVVFVVNATIGPSIASGPGNVGYEGAKALFKKNLLGKIFCFDLADDCELPAEKTVPYCRSWLKRQLLGVLSRLHRRYPVISGRRRIEQWMDAFFAANLTRNDGDVMYCPKPIYPETIRRARELGMHVLVETSVLHPRFNLDVVGAERKRLGIRGAAGYTDERRVKNIEMALESADRIFARSEFMRDSYIKYGVPMQKFLGDVDFAPPGIDTERFYPDESEHDEEFIVLHISSISIIKGVQYLLDAWERLADTIDGRLIILGPADRDMRRILTRRKISNMEWLGRTNDPASWYRRASVFISPSLSDAGPRTVLEAMACGLPAIVSDHCGVSRSISPGENGFVYRYDDPVELASHIEWSYKNREELREMGRKARKMVANYSLSDYGEEIEQRIAVLTESVKVS
jgi:glycosyltransferase involved in cell wall biosynthesis